MLKKRFWLFLILLFISIVSIFFFWQTLHEATASQKLKISVSQTDNKDSEEFTGIVMRIPGTDKNHFWELHVNKFSSQADIGHLENINGRYMRNQSPLYWISGKQGVIHWTKRVLTITGNVELKTNDHSKKIIADEIVWDPNQQIFSAKNHVTLNTDLITIYTEAIKSNLKLNQIVFNGVTKVIYQRDSHE